MQAEWAFFQILDCFQADFDIVISRETGNNLLELYQNPRANPKYGWLENQVIFCYALLNEMFSEPTLMDVFDLPDFDGSPESEDLAADFLATWLSRRWPRPNWFTIAFFFKDPDEGFEKKSAKDDILWIKREEDKRMEQ